MTLAEWSAQIIEELRAMNFAVELHSSGFPLAPCPADFHEVKRLLEFKTTLECNRDIYKEGMLFTPRKHDIEIPALRFNLELGRKP